jgi:PleD family two-component response regulator
MGIVTASDYPETNATGLVGLADKALYMAKDSGRNCVYQIETDGSFSRLLTESIE